MNRTTSIKYTVLFPALALVLGLLSGCLTAERKEYIYTVKPDGSGSGRIVFHNIMSVEEDSTDRLTTDYSDLVSKYIRGKKFENDHPVYTNVRKRLYESNGKLDGEVTFDFPHYEEVGLYRFEGKGTWMYSTSQFSGFSNERFETSNGQPGGDVMPAVFWHENQTEFRIVTQYDKTDRKSKSLVTMFQRYGTGN